MSDKSLSTFASQAPLAPPGWESAIGGLRPSLALLAPAVGRRRLDVTAEQRLGVRSNYGSSVHSFGDNWWVYGIGYVSKINERNNLYLDLERSSGGVFEQDWAVRGGRRVEM